MSSFLLILLLGAAICLCRASGFVVAVPASMPRMHEALRFVPIAIFAALVVPSLARDVDLLIPKIVSLIIAGVLFRRWRRFDVSILAGWGVLLLLGRMLV